MAIAASYEDHRVLLFFYNLKSGNIFFTIMSINVLISGGSFLYNRVTFNSKEVDRGERRRRCRGFILGSL
jgi:hypothetical protein